MKTSRTAAGWMAALAMLGAAGCDNPFKSDGGDGESSEAEDAAAIEAYSQTVASEDTTVAPVVEINGNNNSVVIIYGDDNAPDNVNRRDQPAAEPESEPAP